MINIGDFAAPTTILVGVLGRDKIATYPVLTVRDLSNGTAGDALSFECHVDSNRVAGMSDS